MNRFGNNFMRKLTATAYQNRKINDMSNKIYENYEQLKNELGRKNNVNSTKNWRNK